MSDLFESDKKTGHKVEPFKVAEDMRHFISQTSIRYNKVLQGTHANSKPNSKILLELMRSVNFTNGFMLNSPW